MVVGHHRAPADSRRIADAWLLAHLLRFCRPGNGCGEWNLPWCPSCIFNYALRGFPDFFASRNNTDDSEKHIETDDVAGARAVVAETITPACPGKVDFRGSLWSAEADTAIPAGEHVLIIERRNLTLFVKRI